MGKLVVFCLISPLFGPRMKEVFRLGGGSPNHPDSYFWGRTTADLAYSVARWYARGGSHMNYYMFFGGINYGRWAAAGVTNMYASDVNLCPDGLPHEPRYSHLGLLHSVLAKYAKTVIQCSSQLDKSEHLPWYDSDDGKWKNGTQQLAFTYSSEDGASLSFVENQATVFVLTNFAGINLPMSPESMILFDESGTILYNTSDTSGATSHRVVSGPFYDSPFHWRVWQEPLEGWVIWREGVASSEPLEQSSVTLGLTEYLWYEVNISVGERDSGLTALEFWGAHSNAYLSFSNGRFWDSVDDHSRGEGDLPFKLRVGLQAGNSTLIILSETLGFVNHVECGSQRKTKGITGSVSLGDRDITFESWFLRSGLLGQVLQVFTTDGSSRVNWTYSEYSTRPLTWFQTEFFLPNGFDSHSSLLLNLTGMGRGHLYVNGHDLGRYWLIPMNDGSGTPTQALYPIPTDYLNSPSESNLLTLAEVAGALDSRIPRLVHAELHDGPPPSYPPNEIVSCAM